MILGHDGEAVDVALQRRALRHRPGHEHPGMLQAEIPVQVAGVVFLDDEGRQLPVPALAPGRRVRGHGFGGLPRVAHRPVRRQAVDGLVAGARVVGKLPAQRRDGVEPVGDAVEHLVHAQVREIRRGDFLPRARRGDRGVPAAAEGVRADGGFGGVVLAPVEEHLPGAVGLAHPGNDQVGMVGLEAAGEFPRDLRNGVGVVRAVERRVQVDALRPRGHRERLHAHAVEDLPAPQGDLGAFGQADALAGVEVEHQPVGVARLPVAPEPPLRNVQLQRRHLREPCQHRRFLRQRVGVGVLRMRDVAGGNPVRRGVLQILPEEHLPRLLLRADAVHPAFARHRATGKLRQKNVGDREVVVHDVGLRRAGGRVQHLVQAGHGQPTVTHPEALAIRSSHRRHPPCRPAVVVPRVTIPRIRW